VITSFRDEDEATWKLPGHNYSFKFHWPDKKQQTSRKIKKSRIFLSALTTDWTTGVRSPPEAEDFFSSLCVQTSFEAHPASYTVGNGGLFPGGKARSGLESDHTPSSVEVKNE
jgi:hypothetical protein